MDATVDDFLNEIDEIAPLKTTNHKEHVWQEIFDKLTGYAYYWNTQTDEVSWTKPLEFKSAKDAEKETNLSRKPNIPPRRAPLFPSTSHSGINDSVKIYKISETALKIAKKGPSSKPPHRTKKQSYAKPRVARSSSDSDNEKITLISSYGNDSDEELDQTKIVQKTNTDLTESQYSDEDDDDIDILTKIQKRAKELETLKGPPVKSDIQIISNKKKNPSGISLIAGYSDSEEELEPETEQPNVSVFSIIPPVPKVEVKISHSTLFPIAPQIDVNDFLDEQSEKPDDANCPPIPINTSAEFDSKAFQRKRRIGINLVNTVKKNIDENQDEVDCNDRKGIGFAPGANESNEAKKDTLYSKFAKGGVMFVKSDSIGKSDEMETNGEVEVVEKEKTIVKESYSTLKEKLAFLSEGSSPATSVQVMLIQSETLFTALKAGGLKEDYIQKWLNETCSDLIKLEKEAAPEGWLLQWDRSHKRYFYQNQTSGESQWEYPQPDVVRCDEAMDICTTPPPGGPADEASLSPPLPPPLRIPTPPPPPNISCDTVDAAPNSEPKVDKQLEPLPPGVDSLEVTAKDGANLDIALDSFYSDIAAIESTVSSPGNADDDKSDSLGAVDLINSLSKKKKNKVKLTQGISMKKKGVSKLVEKWKHVQMNYND